MSTQPPNTPPPYGPPPGVDPRDWARQQRDYVREQQRHQRDQWKANRDQWRNYMAAATPKRRSVLGPVVLIGVGVVATLVYSGHIEAYRFWEWYGRFWPVLLIALGVFLLAEWLVDRDNPTPRRHGGLGLIIALLIVSGIAATGSNHFHTGDWNFGDNDDDHGMNLFRGPEHDYDSTLGGTLPAGGNVVVRLGIRGDISVQPGTGQDITVVAHKRIFRDSESDAKRRADNLKPVISIAGTTATIALDGDGSEQANLAITLPAGAAVQIISNHGDVSINGQQAAVSIDAPHGDVRVRDITGPVSLRSDGADLDLGGVRGTLDLSGKWDDVTIADVTGNLNLNGDYEGDLSVRNAAATHFHSSRTDLTAARIAGQWTMDGEDLHMSEIAGPLKLTTHGKEIELNDISGDIAISNADGSIDVTSAKPPGSVQIDNHSGGIRLTLPGDSGYRFHTDARNGELEGGDFGLSVHSAGEDHNVADGSTGDGANQVTLSTEHGDISIRRASDAKTITTTAPALSPNAVSLDWSGRNAPQHLSSTPAPPAPPKAARTPRAPKPPAVPEAPAPPAIVNQ